MKKTMFALIFCSLNAFAQGGPSQLGDRPVPFQSQNSQIGWTVSYPGLLRDHAFAECFYLKPRLPSGKPASAKDIDLSRLARNLTALAGLGKAQDVMPPHQVGNTLVYALPRADLGSYVTRIRFVSLNSDYSIDRLVTYSTINSSYLPPSKGLTVWIHRAPCPKSAEI